MNFEQLINPNGISNIIYSTEFSEYKNVADFIERSPKVTVMVPVNKADVDKYAPKVAIFLTGSDFDRDGKMDDNTVCNAIYFKH